MENRSRTEYMMRNFFWSTIGTLVSTVLNFVSRTVFIYTLGTVYLGVNGLFSNILGMLSFAELGIGGAISFSLYKPLAENDTEKIKAIIYFYKNAYRLVALVVTVIGICIIPFLDVIVKGADGIDNLKLIYCIFLFNTVTSYLITYKTTLLNADQRNYLITNINTVVKIATMAIQTVVLIVYKNFILYLMVGAIIQLLSKFYMNIFTDKQYPYIKEKNITKLSKDEKNNLYTKIKSLIMHKVGAISINQTDNIITSAFINVGVVGLVSNFVMIINVINMFISSFFNAATAGLGNVIATETVQKRKEIYDNYDFMAFWLFGWSSVCLYFLISPFVTLWIGSDKLIDKATVALLCINYYFAGLRVPLGNIKGAAGVYEQDKWAPIVESAINICVSVIGAIYLGLPGIYIGTLLSGMVPNIVKPYVVYKYIFERKCLSYFKEYIKRILLLVISVLIIELFIKVISINNIHIMFVVKIVMCLIVPNLVFIFAYMRSHEFAYILNMVKKLKK